MLKEWSPNYCQLAVPANQNGAQRVTANQRARKKNLFESNLKPKQHPHHNLTSILKGNEASWNVSARHKLRTNDDDADFRLFVRCSLINT